MPWVCPMCSTNNEDISIKCIVCDYERTSDKVCTLTYNKVQKLGLKGDVVIPAEFNVIGEGAFKGRKDVYSVTLHANVRKIAKDAFYGCINLGAVRSSVELESIGIRAFGECISLRESARAKAKYVAKDAYYISAGAVNSEDRTYSSTVSTYTPTVTIEKAKETPKTVETKPEVKRTPWSKMLFRVILLAASAFLLYPLFEILFSEFQSAEVSRYSAFIVTSFLLLLITAVCVLPSAKGGESFLKRTRMIPSIIILLMTYEFSTIFGELLKWPGVCICSFFIFSESVFLMRSVCKRERRFIVYTVILTILTGIVLWRIIAI